MSATLDIAYSAPVEVSGPVTSPKKITGGSVTASTTIISSVPSAKIVDAIHHIQLSLNWLVLSKTKGGMGYTIAKAKKSNMYQALLDLGGTWNGS